MLDNTLSQTGVQRFLRFAALWMGALFFFVGSSETALFAKCGSSGAGATWKYASTSELIAWDGRWWVTQTSSISMDETTHFDADSKPCSRCGGRPVEDRPSQPFTPPFRTTIQPVVIPPNATLLDTGTPSGDQVASTADIPPGRVLEVAKRPPKDSL